MYMYKGFNTKIEKKLTLTMGFATNYKPIYAHFYMHLFISLFSFIYHMQSDGF